MLEKNKDFDQIKIIDFGASKYHDENVSEPLDEKIGTPYYIAPEILQRKYGNKCDIWSCGVLAYIILCGYPPFNGDSDREIIYNVKKGQIKFKADIWQNISASAKDFI